MIFFFSLVLFLIEILQRSLAHPSNNKIIVFCNLKINTKLNVIKKYVLQVNLRPKDGGDGPYGSQMVYK